ncbi:MAG: PHB depolymerase family esterase [Thermochromatium sp.]
MVACQQDGAEVARLTRYNRLADELGFIVLYPTQSRTTNAMGCWNWFLPDHRRPGEGEAALLAALTQDVAVRYGADPKRLYIAGFSAGAPWPWCLPRSIPTASPPSAYIGLPYGLAYDQVTALTLMHQGPSALVGGQGPWLGSVCRSSSFRVRLIFGSIRSMPPGSFSRC